jgi:hypothetical protein
MATTGSLFAAVDKLMALDDGKGHIFGYVIPKDVRAVTGTNDFSHLVGQRLIHRCSDFGYLCLRSPRTELPRYVDFSDAEQRSFVGVG